MHPLFSTKFFACLLTVELLFFIKNKLFSHFYGNLRLLFLSDKKMPTAKKSPQKEKILFREESFFAYLPWVEYVFLLILTPFRFAYSRAAPLRRFSVLRKISDYPVYDCAGNLLFKFVGS